MEINKEKFSEFIQKLKTEYIRLRTNFKTDMSDDELLKSEDFKKCFKITNIMSTAFSSEDGIDSLYILSSNVDFDVDKLLDSFDVIKESNQKYPIVVEKNDTKS